MLNILLLAAISFHTDFEGGSLGRAQEVKRGHYRCPVIGQVDQDKRNRQASWYYFRIDGARGQALTLDMTDLPGEYNYRPNRGAITAETLPFFSEDGERWKQITDAEYDTAVPLLRLRITPAANRIWIAHQPPYTNRNLDKLLDEVRGNKALSQDIIGKTVQGRDLRLLTITDPIVPAASKKHLWILFRQHAWEAGSSWAGEGAIRFLLSDDPAAVRIRRAAIFKIFPMCDPDGVARGGVRFNINGYDLNRNWDVTDKVKMPEISAQRGAIFRWMDSGGRADMVLTLHNDENPEYLAGPPGPEHRDLMKRFETALSRSRYFSASKPAALVETTTTEGKPGRMTVVQGLYHDRKIASFLIEHKSVKHPKLGRQPTAEDRRAFGTDLVRAMAEASRAIPD
jgi:hypothetical protein